ncbi:hypothetical protein M011DRAFT_393584, partial [Sporormia fimetaria CBS 119925]
TRTIKVYVGPEPEDQVFDVHAGLISNRSEFFKAALSGRWAASKNNTVKLPEDDPKVFGLYLQYLYRNILPGGEQGDAEAVIRQLCELYVLCDKLVDPETRKAVLNALSRLCDKTKKLPALDCVQSIYDSTMEADPARKLLVRVYTENGTNEAVDWPDETISHDFFFDLSRSLINQRSIDQANKRKRELEEQRQRKRMCPEPVMFGYTRAHSTRHPRHPHGQLPSLSDAPSYT